MLSSNCLEHLLKWRAECKQEAFAISREEVEALQSERDTSVAEAAALRKRLDEWQSSGPSAAPADGEPAETSATLSEDAAMQAR